MGPRPTHELVEDVEPHAHAAPTQGKSGPPTLWKVPRVAESGLKTSLPESRAAVARQVLVVLGIVSRRKFMKSSRLVPVPKSVVAELPQSRDLHFLDNQRSVKQLTTLSRFAPLNSAITTSIWRQEGVHGTETRTS